MLGLKVKKWGEMIKGMFTKERKNDRTWRGDSKSLDNYFEGFSFGLCWLSRSV